MSASLPTECIKMLIAVLEQFKRDDLALAAEGNPFHYSGNIEYDSNQTLFEMLSNSNLMVVKSHLPEHKQAMLIAILYALYADNYWRFDCDYIDSAIYQDDSDILLTANEITKMRNYNVAEWYRYLCNEDNDIVTDCYYEADLPAVAPEYYSHRLYIAELKKQDPGINEYRVKSPPQRVLTIDDIIAMACEKI